MRERKFELNRWILLTTAHRNEVDRIVAAGYSVLRGRTEVCGHQYAVHQYFGIAILQNVDLQRGRHVFGSMNHSMT